VVKRRALWHFARRFPKWMTYRLGLLGGIAILIIMVSTLIEVTARYVFNKPTMWAIPLNVYTLVGLTFLAASYTWARGGHIKVDIFYNRWSAKTQAVVNIVTLTLGLSFLAVVIVGGWELTMLSLKLGSKTSGGTLQWVLWPDHMLVPIGTAIVFLQALVFWFANFRALRRQT